MIEQLRKLLAEIKEREAAATPEPWCNIPIMREHGRGYICTTKADPLISNSGCFLQEADAKFAAAARTDIPRLVQALEGLLAVLVEADQTVTPFARLGMAERGTPAFHDLEENVIIFRNSNRHVTTGDVRRLYATKVKLSEALAAALAALRGESK